MPTQKTSTTKKENPAMDNTKLLKQLVQQQYGPYQEGVVKALKTMGEQQATEAIMSGVPAEHIESQSGVSPLKNIDLTGALNGGNSQELLKQLSNVLKPAQGMFSPAKITPEGQIQEGGALSWIGGHSTSNLLKRMLVLSDIQNKNKVNSAQKNVYGFDPTTGKVSLQAQVPEGSDVRNLQPQTGIEQLPPEERSIARAMARKLYGVRGAEKGLSDIVDARLTGINFDQIEDKIRFSTQSKGFEDVRDAVQTISVGDSDTVRNANFDALDDYIQKGDTEGAKDYIKQMALSHATADQQNLYYGQERTIDFLGEIKNDIKELENAGVDMNWMRGNWEDILGRIGLVGNNPNLRKLATKIALGVIQYRRAMTGVQFGQAENLEYKKLFPSTKAIAAFSSSNIDALTETFQGNLDKFYSLKMGRNNYKKIFGNTVNKDNSDISTMSDDELRAIIVGGGK